MIGQVKVSIAHALVHAAFEQTEEFLNVSALARMVGVSPQRMHGYWTGRFPWPADVAIAVLAASGRLRLAARGFVYDGDVPLALAGLLGTTGAGAMASSSAEISKITLTGKGQRS